MRKVTASAVILTALTGCGQNGGLPNNQWSFEVPAEDGISSLQQNSRFDEAGADSSLASAADSFPKGADGVVPGMMGPAFSQSGIGTFSSANAPAGRRSGSQGASSFTSASAAFSPSSSARYQSVQARPDPVADVKSFLSSSGSPSSLTSRAPFRAQSLLSAVPANPPISTAAIASTLGDPTGIEATPTGAGSSASFVSNSLPAVGFPDRNSYSAAGASTLNASSFVSNSAQPALVSPNYLTAVPVPPIPFSNTSVDTSAPVRVVDMTPLVEAYSSPAGNEALVESGLPVLEPIAPSEVSDRMVTPVVVAATPTTAEPLASDSTGTTILRDLQRTAPAQSLSENANRGTVSVDISPAADSADSAVVSAENEPAAIELPAASPVTLKSLRRTMVVQSDSPMVLAARRAVAMTESDSAAMPEIAREVGPETTPEISLTLYPSEGADASGNDAGAASNVGLDLPTLERLLETMPESAKRPGLEVDSLSVDREVSPLLQGLDDVAPLSTLYVPIPEASLEAIAQQPIAQMSSVDPTARISSVATLIGNRVIQSGLLNNADSLSDTVSDADSAAAADFLLQDLRQRGLIEPEAVASEVAAMRRDRNITILSLVNKHSAKQRQLVTR